MSLSRQRSSVQQLPNDVFLFCCALFLTAQSLLSFRRQLPQIDHGMLRVVPEQNRSPRFSRDSTPGSDFSEMDSCDAIDNTDHTSASRSSSVSCSSSSSVSSSSTAATTVTTVTTTTKKTVRRLPLHLLPDASSQTESPEPEGAATTSSERVQVDASTQTEEIEPFNLPIQTAAACAPNASTQTDETCRADASTQIHEAIAVDAATETEKGSAADKVVDSDASAQTNKMDQNEVASQITNDVPDESNKRESGVDPAVRAQSVEPQDASMPDPDNVTYKFDVSKQLPPDYWRKPFHHRKNSYNRFIAILKLRMGRRGPPSYLDLNDAGRFEWRQIRHLIRDDVQHKIKLPGRSLDCDHFAFTRKRDDRTFVKLMSYPRLDTNGRLLCEFEKLPICHHLDKERFLQVAACFMAYAKGRLEEYQNSGCEGRSPTIRTQILRCSLCPSEYRFGVSSRQLSLQYTPSKIRRRWQARVEWIERPKQMHFVFERWINLGVFDSRKETEWTALRSRPVKHQKLERILKKREPRLPLLFDWDKKGFESARSVMEPSEADEEALYNLEGLKPV